MEGPAEPGDLPRGALHAILRGRDPATSPHGLGARLLAREAGFLLSGRANPCRLFLAVLVAMAACGIEGERPVAVGRAVVDDAGREVRLAGPARRVASLVPAVTETILALEAGDRLVARTDYDEAREVAHLPSVGGGLDPGVEALLALRPDLVVVWDARDDAGLRARLEAAGVPVYAAAIEDTTGVFATIARVGVLLGREDASAALAAAIRDSLGTVAAAAAGPPRPRVLFLLEGDPPRTAGVGTFVSQLVGVAGGRHPYPTLPGQWPSVALEAVVADPPDVVVVPVSSGGAPDLAGRPGWRAVPAVRAGRVIGLPADLVRPGPGIARIARAIGDSLRAVAARAGGT